jgi:hypothetical protein
MRRAALVLMLAVVLSNCSVFQQKPGQDFFGVFFVPGTTELSPDAQAIVRQAAQSAKDIHAARIDVALPPDAPGGADLTEGRFTAIQNILSASGIGAGVLQRASLSDAAAKLPGAADRAEIRLLH